MSHANENLWYTLEWLMDGWSDGISFSLFTSFPQCIYATLKQFPFLALISSSSISQSSIRVKTNSQATLGAVHGQRQQG
jgi:hypothetical protein